MSALYHFNRVDYPEQAACMALPELEPGITSVELTDWDDNKLLLEVLSGAVHRINMPRLSSSIPAEVQVPFERGIGLSLLACRILNRNDDLVSIEVPTIRQPSTVVVPFVRLARRRSQ